MRDTLRALRPALAYLPRYRGDLVRGYLCLVPSPLPTFLALALLRQGIDEALAGPISGGRLALLAGGAMALTLVACVLRFGMRWYLVGASRLLERDLRDDLFGKLLSLPAAWHDQRTSGDTLARMTTDVESVRMTIGPGLMYVASTAVSVPMALVMMARTDPVLTAWVLGPMVAIAVVFRLLSPAMQQASTDTQETIGQVSAEASEAFSGVRVLKIFTREAVHVRRLGALGQDYLSAQRRLADARGRMHSLLSLVKDLGLLAILFLGARRTLDGAMTVGDLFLFQGLLLQCYWPMIALGWMSSLLHRGAAAMDRIQGILAQESPLTSPAEPAQPAPVAGDLEFDRVSVHHEGIPALEEVCLRVPFGQSLGITGRTGSGKSTLARLIPRLRDPDQGRILLGGRDLREWPLDQLRRTVGLVPQESFLFAESLRDNLRFARTDATDEAVGHALRRAALDQDLADLPQGLDTTLGERGITLSGGQRQRATLVRTLLQDPPVLVLDDCLSAVDAHTEARILSRLEETLSGRTTLVISHRIAALRGLDRILVLDHGRIVEEGTHQELLAADGVYAALERRQRLEQELEDL